LGSVELGKYGSIVSAIVMTFLRLVPMVFRPARLRGSIHRYGKQLRLLATLDQAGGRKKQGESVQLWEVVRMQDSDEHLAETVEELAYRIYLDLASDDLFKSWEAFRAYTTGMAHYVSWIDLEREIDWQEAEKHYSAAIDLEPKNPAIKYNLALLKYFRFRGKDNDEAIDLFQGALNARNRQLSARARAGLASALAMKYHRFNVAEPRLLQEATLHARMAITLAPEIDGVHKAYALSCHQWSEYLVRTKGPAREVELHRQLAVDHYRKACELNPQHYMAYNNLGNLFLEWGSALPPNVSSDERSGKFAAAKTALEEAIRVNPAYHHAHDNLGNTFYVEGKFSRGVDARRVLFEQAAKSYRNALQYSPSYPEGTNDLAMLHLESDYQDHSVAQAFSLHAQSLRHAAAAKYDTQMKKLCRQFSERLKATTASQSLTPLNLESSVLAELNSLSCHCVSVLPAATPVQTRDEIGNPAQR
jgi:tetratricopeptide (TPR) repeat protein